MCLHDFDIGFHTIVYTVLLPGLIKLLLNTVSLSIFIFVCNGFVLGFDMRFDIGLCRFI